MQMKWILFYVLPLGFSRTNGEVTWPSGTYGLPKAKSGCPQSEGALWSEGWRLQDMSFNRRTESKISPNSHMHAKMLNFKRFVNRTFCVKNSPGTLIKEWPKGFYCVYKSSASACQTGMTSGWTKWHDRERGKFKVINKKGGVLPDGDYGHDTVLKYCCQDQGHWYDSIELPVDRPFYLLPHHSSSINSPKCQRVKWALSLLEYIIYNNRNVTQDSDNNHVFTELTHSSLPKLFYCYYKGCYNKITGNYGSFTSLLHLPSRYPSFQYCSWLVTVSETVVVSLQFTYLSVPDCDQNFIKIYDGINDTAPVLGTYCGLNASARMRVISSSNNMYLVLKSGNYSKNPETILSFQANYNAQVKQTKRTSTKSAVNTTDVSPHAKLANQNVNGIPVSSVIIAVIAGVTITALIMLIVILYNRRKTRQREISPNFLRGLNPSYDRKITSAANQTDFEGYAAPTCPEERLWLGGSRICKESRNPIYQSGEDDATNNFYCSADNIIYKEAMLQTGDINNSLYETPVVCPPSVFTEPTTSVSEGHYDS